MITTADVQAILGDVDVTGDDIDVFIESAIVFNDRAFDGETLAADLRFELDRWIAAHLISATRNRPVKSQEAGGAKQVFEGAFGMGLKGTAYGQTAIALDPTGVLEKMAGGIKPGKIRAITSF